MNLVPVIGSKTRHSIAFVAAFGMLLAGARGQQASPPLDKTQNAYSSVQKAPAGQSEETQSQQAASSATPEDGASQAGTNAGSSSAAERAIPKIEKRNLSYALGVDTGRGLKQQEIDVDLDSLIKGLKEAYADEKLTEMSEHEVVVTLSAFNKLRKEQYEEALKHLAEENKTAGEKLIAENAKKEGVVTLPSGLQYRILKEGNGKRPTLDDKVVCHYRGMLVDGKEFDDSYKRKQPVTFPVRGVIKGWTEALQLMPVSSKWELFVPPQLAYGERGARGLIGPNATLRFEVELLSIENPVRAAAQSAETSAKKDLSKPQ